MKDRRYVVFDVETPNRLNSRMSAIGVSVVEGGQIVRDFYSLVDPEQPFDWFNSVLTGINEETVFDAPSFPELWPELEPILSSGILVAHNASFDLGVLRKCLAGYEIEWKPTVKGVCTVVMGRNTWDSLPKKPLPNRRNVVLSRNLDLQYDNCEVFHSFEEFEATTSPDEIVFVIGGAQLYQQFVNQADNLFITHIHSNFQADVFFPIIDAKIWQSQEEIFVPKDEMNPFDFHFATYSRK